MAEARARCNRSVGAQERQTAPTARRRGSNKAMPMSENGKSENNQGARPADEQTGATAELDALGLRCPLPVLKLRKRLQALPEGATITMIADDPAARIDVPHFCAEQGHELIEELEIENGALRFVVRKGASGGRATSAS